MSRWATFHYDMIREYISGLKIHPDKETALKYFNQNYKRHFELNTKFKADKLPASYGYSFRKYWGISAQAFKKKFGISVDEALKISKGETKC
jgi:hypothetical protein